MNIMTKAEAKKQIGQYKNRELAMTLFDLYLSESFKL